MSLSGNEQEKAIYLCHNRFEEQQKEIEQLKKKSNAFGNVADRRLDVIKEKDKEIERLESKNAELIGQCIWLQTRNDVLFEWKEKLKAALIKETADQIWARSVNQKYGFKTYDEAKTCAIAKWKKKMPYIFTDSEPEYKEADSNAT